MKHHDITTRARVRTIQKMTFYLTLVCAAIALFWASRGRPNTLEITHSNYRNNQFADIDFFTIGDAAYFSTKNATYCYVNGRTSIVSLYAWRGQESEEYIAAAKVEDKNNFLWVYRKETKKEILKMCIDPYDWDLSGNTLYYVTNNRRQLRRVRLDTLQDEFVLESSYRVSFRGELDSGEILYKELREKEMVDWESQVLIYSPSDKSTRLLTRCYPWSTDGEDDLQYDWSGNFLQDDIFWYADYTQSKGRIMQCNVKTGEIESVYEGPFSGLANVSGTELYLSRAREKEAEELWEVAYYRVDLETGEESLLGGFRYQQVHPDTGVSVLNDDTYLLRYNDHVTVSKNGVCSVLKW